MKYHKNSDFLLIIALFIIWRSYLFLVAYFAPEIVSKFGEKFPYYNERLISTNLPHYIWSFGNFDGVHYIGIAKEGYAHQFTQAFFPLYPILMRIVSTVANLNLVASGLLVSNLAFVAGLLVFFKLVSTKYNKNIALWSSIFLLTFPTSFYFGSVYTESLFFSLIILAFYLFEKNKIIAGSIVGSLASFSRLVGIFLSIPIKKENHYSLYPVLIVPLGLVIYMLYLKINFNNSFYFLTSQSAFGQERSTTEIILLPQVIFRSLKQLLTTEGLILFNSAFELTSLLLTLALLVISWKLVKREWVIFSFLAIITPTLTGTLASMPRYVLVAFPIFIVLAYIKNTLLKVIILLIFIGLLTVSSILFTRGYWIA